MRVLAFSDLHRDVEAARGVVAAAATADLVVGAGDFATMRRGMADTIDVLRALTVPVVLVAGNHDGLDDLRDACAGWSNCHVLHGHKVSVGGTEIFGLGFEIASIDRGSWSSQIGEADAARALAACPSGALLVTHAPPYGVADLQRNGAHEGSRAIRAAIEEKRPRLHLCGHIHNAWGTRGVIADCPVHNLGPTVNWFEI